jgi:uncharacterized protein HemY
MKKMIFFVVLFVLLALWGLGLIFPDAGYVLVVLGQKTVETSLWFVCFSLVSAWFILWLASCFINFLHSLVRRAANFFIPGSLEQTQKVR